MKMIIEEAITHQKNNLAEASIDFDAKVEQIMTKFNDIDETRKENMKELESRTALVEVAAKACSWEPDLEQAKKTITLSI